MKLLKPVDGVRVENMLGKGTPDVNYTGGWIELKQQDKWPVRASTKVKLNHDLSLEQRIWLSRRERKGGTAWVLLQIARDYMLFTGTVASEVIGECTQGELKAAAYRVWTSKQMKEELLSCLQQGI
tara:strand:- start:29978 stop:30355 length:378 start_codon:yes stop_codon:yes gene_type:complete